MIGRTVAHYRVLERLGTGGMGVVYKAQDLKLDRPVALKFLSVQFQADEYHNRFLLEARSASTLDHPNICTIYEINETEDGQMFIAMAYYEGQTLYERIRKGALPLSQTLSYVDQILQGLSKAHERGIVHRDIKSGNVMITKDDLAKILDFGLAKLIGQLGATGTGVAVGTLHYMSPEQVNGSSVDQRTDIWSAGVVLYECLTGRLPFHGDSTQTIMSAILSREIESVTKLRPDVPPEVERILQKALSKNLETRYQSVLEMSADLRKVMAGMQQKDSAPTQDFQLSVVRTPNLERRHLTILMGRLFGHAELVEYLPPEEVDSILRKIQDIASKTVEEHGGSLNRFSGEEFVCLFGIPSAREDDSVRAVRCALGLQCNIREASASVEERTGQKVRLMSGISGGMVVAEAMSGAESKYRVTGEAVQIAARLATESEPDEVLVTAELQRALAPYFEMVSCPAFSLKGKGQTITPYRVSKETGFTTRLEASKQSGLTPFTGRDRELAVLAECLDAACAGEGRFVSISGEAGIGKSRLMHEFHTSIQDRQLQIGVGRCQPGRANLLYAPFAGALRELLGLQEEVEGAGVAGEIIQRVLELDPSLSDFIPIYLYLLSARHPDYSLPAHLQGEDLRLATGEAICAIFAGFSLRRPLVLFLEDWHGADQASRSVLKQFMDVLPAYPILIIAAFRPEMVARDHVPPAQTTIQLNPMEPAVSKKVLCAILNASTVSEDVASLILDKTGGNPFFMEEVCSTLLEEGIISIADGTAVLRESPTQLRLPDTVEAVIRTRLDRLEAGDRDLLRIASVVGREFSRSILQRLAPADFPVVQALENLKTLGLIRQTSVLPEARYRFKNVLTMEVAYGSLLPHKRKSLHAATAQVIEGMSSARTEEHMDSLVSHFAHAEEWERAIHYATLSEQRLNKLGQYAEALEVLQKVAGWLLKLSQDSQWQQRLVDNLLSQERLCETLGQREKQLSLIAELEGMLERMPDPRKLTEVNRRKGDVCALLGRFDAAQEALNTALRISREMGGAAEERNVLRSLGYLRWRQGSYGEAAEINRNVIDIDRKLGDEQSVAGDLANLGNVYRHLGDLRNAMECVQESLAIYSRHPDPVKQSTALHSLSTFYRDLGNQEKAHHYIREALEVSIKNHLLINQSFHLTGLGNLLWQQGKGEEGLAAFKQAVEVNRKTRHVDGLAPSLMGLADILMALGKQEEALPYFVESATLFESLGDLKSELHVRSAAATIQENEGRIADAMAHWESIRTIQQALGDQPGEAQVLETQARLSKMRGDPPETILEYHAQALKLLENANDRPKVAAQLNSVGILEWSLGRYESALNHYNRALEIFREIGDPIHEGFIRNSIGVTLSRLGREDLAIQELERAAALNHENREYLLEGHSYAAMGDAWRAKGNLFRSLECYETSLAIRRQIGDRKGEGWMLVHRGKVLAGLNELERAKESIAQAMKIALDLKDDQLIHSCEESRRSWEGGADAQVHH